MVPSERAVPGVQDHVPSACAVVVQRIVPLALRRVIVVPESAVPEKVGVVLFVCVPFVGDVITGTLGANVSISTATERIDPVFTPSSRYTEIIYVSFGREEIIGIDQSQLADTTPV